MSYVALNLPDDATAWARSRVEAGEAASVEAYFVELARRDREATEEGTRLQAAVDEGLASGVDPRPGRQIFAEVRAKYFGNG